jgi:hypothetical protein
MQYSLVLAVMIVRHAMKWSFDDPWKYALRRHAALFFLSAFMHATVIDFLARENFTVLVRDLRVGLSPTLHD